MLRAIQIDDELHCIERLRWLINEYHAGDVLLMAECTTVEEGIACIQRLRPDVIFLDVQINDKTGFDLLNAMDAHPFSVVFTTAHEKFAVQAFRFSAFDYLLKPIDSDELSSTILRLKEEAGKREHLDRMGLLLQNVNFTSGHSGRISVPTMNGLVMLETDKIIRLESDVNYTTIYPDGEKKLTVAKTLKEFEELLSSRGFYRVHNSHLVNLSYVKTYNKGKGGSIMLRDGTEIEVSMRRKDEFLQRLMGQYGN